MLILTRRAGESILIGDDVEIMVTNVKKGQVKIGIVADPNKRIARKEIADQYIDADYISENLCEGGAA